jgi:hypothetical protein
MRSWRMFLEQPAVEGVRSVKTSSQKIVLKIKSERRKKKVQDPAHTEHVPILDIPTAVRTKKSFSLLVYNDDSVDRI